MVCDRCGNKDFLTEGEIDRGNHFWVRISLPDEKGVNRLYDLCPICSSVYETMTRRFMDAVMKKSDDCSDCDWKGHNGSCLETGKALKKGFDDGVKAFRESGENICEGSGTDG
jgi:hypothetical protein